MFRKPVPKLRRSHLNSTREIHGVEAKWYENKTHLRFKVMTDNASIMINTAL